MKLKDKVALITGGGSGIGRAIALAYAREGAQVVVNDINLDTARQTVEAMGDAKPRSLAIKADVSNSAEVRAMFDEVGRKLGRVDILVNNAGMAEVEPGDWGKLNERAEARINESLSGEGIKTAWDITREMSDESWLKIINTHLNGSFFCAREALKLMGEGGAIINMSSVAGLMGLEAAPHYSAAKAGLIGFTRALARELGSLGIRVNAICPGWIETPMTDPMGPMLKMISIGQTPLGRFGTADEVARVALFLASDDGAFVTGQWLSPNGGLFTG